MAAHPKISFIALAIADLDKSVFFDREGLTPTERSPPSLLDAGLMLGLS